MREHLCSRQETGEAENLLYSPDWLQIHERVSTSASRRLESQVHVVTSIQSKFWILIVLSGWLEISVGKGDCHQAPSLMT